MSKKSNEYWEKRTAQYTWDTYNSIEEKNRALLEQYQQASHDINSELYSLAEKVNKGKGLTRSEVYKFNRLNNLNKKIKATLYDLSENIETFSTNNMYEGFKGVYNNVMASVGVIDFALPDKKLMDTLLQQKWRGNNFSQRLWRDTNKLAKNLNGILLRGLQQGKTVSEMAIDLNNAMNKGFNKAHTLIRTETMHYLNMSSDRAFIDAGVKEVIHWAAEDERTCEKCGALHGEKYPIDKAPMIPVHPVCRCTHLPVLDNDITVNTENKYSVEKGYNFSDGKSGGTSKQKDAKVFKYDDVKIYIPQNLNTTKQTISVDKAYQVFSKMPDKLKNEIESIELLDYQNPMDSYWAKTYKIKNFKSFATGGEKKIAFYANGYRVNNTLLYETMIHESAHNIDKSLGGNKRISESKKYFDAKHNDDKLNNTKFPSKYAEEAYNGNGTLTEDFAEGMALYLTDQDKSNIIFPNRTKIYIEVLK